MESLPHLDAVGRCRPIREVLLYISIFYFLLENSKQASIKKTLFLVPKRIVFKQYLTKIYSQLPSIILVTGTGSRG